MREFGSLIGRVGAGKQLSREECKEAYRQIILNEQPELQQGAFLAAHHSRGATVEELCGAWEALDSYDTAKIDASGLGIVCDIVGTGSDSLKTVNCSTPASIIAAACGVVVAKKGARKVTGVSGATCVLENLGVNVQAPLTHAESMLKSIGICYLPGETFLQSGWARLIRSLRFTSAFNVVGPLTRPCPQTTVSIVGGYSPEVCDQMAVILQGIGMPFAACPYGMVDGRDASCGMDEFSPCGPTRVSFVRQGSFQTIMLQPEDFGVARHPVDAIASRTTARDNADVIQATLEGRGSRALEDFFAMNAAAALVGAGKVSNWSEGTAMALSAIRTGSAARKLEAMRGFCELSAESGQTSHLA